MVKEFLLKSLEVCLYLHGFLCFVEVGVAIYEKAYITAGLAAFGAIVMTLSGIFLTNNQKDDGSDLNV
jgi:hypothetical protein